MLPFVTVRLYQYVLSQAFVELDNINYIKDSVSFIYLLFNWTDACGFIDITCLINYDRSQEHRERSKSKKKLSQGH